MSGIYGGISRSLIVGVCLVWPTTVFSQTGPVLAAPKSLSIQPELIKQLPAPAQGQRATAACQGKCIACTIPATQAPRRKIFSGKQAFYPSMRYHRGTGYGFTYTRPAPHSLYRPGGPASYPATPAMANMRSYPVTQASAVQQPISAIRQVSMVSPSNGSHSRIGGRIVHQQPVSTIQQVSMVGPSHVRSSRPSTVGRYQNARRPTVLNSLQKLLQSSSPQAPAAAKPNYAFPKYYVRQLEGDTYETISKSYDGMSPTVVPSPATAGNSSNAMPPSMTQDDGKAIPIPALENSPFHRRGLGSQSK